MATFRFSHLNQCLCTEAAAGGEPEPGAAAGDADRRQALADERPGRDEGDPSRRAFRLAAEGTVDPRKRPMTKIDDGRALCWRQGISWAPPADTHRTTASTSIASFAGCASARGSGESRRLGSRGRQDLATQSTPCRADAAATRMVMAPLHCTNVFCA